MNEFKNYNPAVNFIYFALAIGFSMFFMHPVCLAISFLCTLMHLAVIKGASAGRMLFYLIPMLFITALINPAFNHEGMTVLCYLPSGNPLTAESVLYGLCAAVMLACVICRFSCFNAIMTSDKIIYIFGKILPSTSLVISMTLRFVPRFSKQLKTVSAAQKCMGQGRENGIVNRAKSGINILSAMITWSLENSVDTADSMRARGYGLSGRTAFEIFRFEKRDFAALFVMLFLGIYVFIGKLCGCMEFACFPKIEFGARTAFSVSVFAAYAALSIFPVIIEIYEVIRWKYLKRKI